MSTTLTKTKVSAEDLREEVRKEYAGVALDPHKGYHFHTGRAAADRLGQGSPTDAVPLRRPSSHCRAAGCWLKPST